MLLEQGYDPNDKVMDWGWPEALKEIHHDRALHMAAEQGDGDMVDLLLEFGARNDRIEGWQKEHPDTPAERALAHGHSEIAARIAGSVTVASVEGGVAGLNMNSNGGEA
jgi:ankyrin repeat protein